MHLRYALTIMLLSVHGAALCTPDNEQEKFFIKQMTFVTDVIGEYCAEAAPETHTALTAELSDFNTRLITAAAPVIARLRAEGVFDNKIPAGHDQSLVELKQKMRADLQKLDPHLYCTQFTSKLKSMDVNALLAAAAQAHQKYMSAAQPTPPKK